MDEQVTIAMPQSDPNLSTSSQEANQPQEAELSTNNPQSPDVWIGDSCTIENCEHFQAWLKEKGLKGPGVPGAGRDCSFCKKSEKYLALSKSYLEKFENKTGEKLAIPFIEELAMILHRDSDTLENWEKKTLKDSDTLEHPDFAKIMAQLRNIQKLRLLQRTLGRYNPTGAIFQLKVNHNMVETEKKIVAGDTKDPLIVKIVEDKKADSDE